MTKQDEITHVQVIKFITKARKNVPEMSIFPYGSDQGKLSPVAARSC